MSINGWFPSRIVNFFLIALISIWSATDAGAQRRPHGPRAKDVKIRKKGADGPGCPPGSYNVLITSSVPDGPADFFEVIFDDFKVESGPGIKPQEKRKHCTVTIDLEIPAGLRFLVANVSYEGFAHIAKQSIGTLTTDYFFPTHSFPVSTQKVIKGFFDGSYSQDDTISSFSPLWSPCGKKVPLTMKSTLRIDGPRQESSIMTVDLQTGILVQKWALTWESCTP